MRDDEFQALKAAKKAAKRAAQAGKQSGEDAAKKPKVAEDEEPTKSSATALAQEVEAPSTSVSNAATKTAPGMVKYLEGPHNPLGVSLVQATCSFWINRRKFRMKRRRALFFQTPVKTVPNIRRDNRHIVEPRHQCLQVQTGSANNNGDMMPALDVPDRLQGEVTPFTRRTPLLHAEHAIEMMRCQCCFQRVGARSNQWQIFIYLHGIGVDDLPGEFTGQRQCHRRFTACGRPADNDDRFLVQPFAILSATKRCVPPVSIRTRMVFNLAFIACFTLA